MAKKGIQLSKEQQTAIDALIKLGFNKGHAHDMVTSVPGHRVEELVENAFRRHQGIREGKIYAPVAAPVQRPPEPLPAGAPPLPRGASVIAPVRNRLGQSLQGVGQGFRNWLLGPQPQPVGPPQPQPQPAPPPQQIPGMGPPGGPQAAPQPEQLQQQAQALAAQSLARTQANLGPQGMATAQAAPTVRQGPPPMMPMPAPVKPRIRVQATPGTAPAAPQAMELPLISSQEEYNKLPLGAHFRHPDGGIYRKVAHSAAGGEPQKMQGGGLVQQPQQELLTEQRFKPQVNPETGEEMAEAEPVATTPKPQEATLADTDSVNAKLTPGEFVVPKKAVDQIGAPALEDMSSRAAAGLPALPTGTVGMPNAPVGRGAGGGGGGKSDVHGAVYEQYGWEGHAANYGPKGNRLGEGYGVGLGVDKQKEVGAHFGDWVRVDFGDGTSVIRQVNETSERPNGVEFFTNHQGTYNNRGKATVTKLEAPA